MSSLYKKILVPLDGSALAAQALPHAEEIARGAGARLILFHVLENPAPIMAAMPGMGGMGAGVGIGVGGAVSITLDDDAHRQRIDQTRESLDDLATTLHHRKVEADVEVGIGDPATQIVDYAAANAVDLIVMSTHGRTGVARWAYGSVANKVLHAAPCAVHVVRSTLTG